MGVVTEANMNDRWGALTALLHLVHVVSQEGEFKVLPKRGIVERIFSWLGHRRLSKDYQK